MAPPSDGVEWNDGGREGTRRFLFKLWDNLYTVSQLEEIDTKNSDEEKLEIYLNHPQYLILGLDGLVFLR